MNVQPRHPLLPPEGMSEAEWIAIRDAQADAEIAAGRGIPHEQMKAWARKLGTPDEKPMPREWLK
jgi:predicted transcriptional regulator